MTGWNDVRGDMEPSSLDPWIADKLLSGAVGPDDALPGWADVVTLVRDARAPAEPDELAGEASAVAAMVSVLSGASTAARPGAFRSSRLRRLKLIAVGAAVMVLAMVGLAFAGALPAPAQEVASIVLAKVGVSVPRGHSSNRRPEQGRLPQGPKLPGPAQYGLCTAYDSGQGGTKGKKTHAVPFEKLQGTGQGPAEECVNPSPGGGQGGARRGSSQGHGPVVPTPNARGSGTGDSASDGGSEKSTDHHSGGRSSGS